MKKIMSKYQEFLSKDTRFTTKKVYESSTMYISKIRSFLEYLDIKYNLESIDFSSLDEETIIGGLTYFIHTREIEFKVTAQNYISALRSFFEYLREGENVVNPLFNQTDNENILNEKLEKVIVQHKLLSTRSKNIVSEETFNNIAIECNKYIDELSVEEIIKEINEGIYNKKYYDFVSSLALKFVQYFGLKNGMVRNLSIDDIVDFNRIKVNNYVLHISHNFSQQIKKYLELRDYVVTYSKADETNALFINIHGKEFGVNDSEQFFRVLKKLINTQEVETVAKYTVCRLIESGVSRKQIMNLTGFGYETFIYCEEFMNSMRDEYVTDYHMKIEFDRRFIDSKLRGTEAFVIV